MLITPSVNYRELLGKVIKLLDYQTLDEICGDAFTHVTFTDEEKKVLEEIW